MNGDASSFGLLVSTPPAARALGISARTLQRYVEQGVVEPAVRLPSGQYRWDVAALVGRIATLTSAPTSAPSSVSAGEMRVD